MNKCIFRLTVTVATLIIASVTADICELCVPLSKCNLFAKMDRAEQESWMRKYPCNNHHPDDYGTPPGSLATQGEICCPNQIWGIEPKITEDKSSRITDVNTVNGQDTPGAFGDQSQYPYYLDINTQNQDNSVANNDGYIYNNKQADSDGTKQNSRGSNIEPSRWPLTNRNIYWNDRPDRNKWDIGNQNFYHGNNNRRLFNNNRRNYYGNDRRDGRNNFYNQGPRRNTGDGLNNQGFDGSQKYSPYYPSNRQPGNSFGKTGQCDRLTSFPPNPQSECCGREASDDDSITGTPFKLNDNNQLETKLTKTIDDAPYYNDNAPAFHNRNNNWRRRSEEQPDYGWSYSMYKEENVNSVTVNNNTITVVNGTKGGTVAVENRISGGKETELTQYPWTVLLISTFENGFQRTSFNCGGSLISARFILTAGHCVYDAEAVIKGVQVFLAEFDKRTFPRDCKITAEGRKCIINIALESEDVVLHPRFDEKRLQNDIALIRLQKDAPYTEYIRPICLPSINIDNPEHARLPLTVAGWGRNGQYKSDIKQSTTVHLVPQHDCRKFYPDLTPRHLCAAGYTGEDTCKGDSGGPLMVLYRGKYYVVGVVSGKRTDAPCGSTVPSLYTNVYHYLDWIRSNIKS